MSDIDISSIPCMRVFDEEEHPEDPYLGVICGEPSGHIHFAKLTPDPWWLGIPLCEEHGHAFSGSTILNELEKADDTSQDPEVT